jgi:hypothetical protein
MVLRETTRFVYGNGQPRQFWGCSKWPGCKGIHGAHPDGRPLGVPANKETKGWRIKAHAAFDGLWKSGRMTRNEAYTWLSAALGVPSVHIGEMDSQGCREVIRACMVSGENKNLDTAENTK